MAALRENLLLHGHLTSSERNTFSRQREHGMKTRAMHLQQHWLHLKERENKAQQRNRLLLLEFDKAQDTLREMLACNASMKTIRMEYEKYLKECAPYWQQQFKEKSEAAQKKKMEECLRSYLKKTEAEQTTRSSEGLTRMPQKVSAPQENNSQNSCSDYNQDISYLPSTWLTHLQSQTACLPFTEPSQRHRSSHVPPSVLPSPATFPSPHLFPSMLGHHHLWPKQEWISPQPNQPQSWTTGAPMIPSDSEALWGQLNMEESPCEREMEKETSRSLSSQRVRVNGSQRSHLSQELDINPVRLCSGQAESSDSGRDSSQAGRERRKKKTRRVFSDRGRCSSEESSRTSSAIVTSEATKVQRSESGGSSQKSSTSGSKRTKLISRGSAAGSLRKKKVVNQKPMVEGNSSEVESCSAAGESVCHSEESRSEDEENQSPCDELSSAEEDEEEACRNNLQEGEDGDGEGKISSQRGEERDKRHVEGDDEVPDGKSTPGEEEETETEEELEDQGDEEGRSKDDHGNHKKKDSSFSQDEELDEDDYGSNGKKMVEEEEESGEEDADKEEEQESDEAEEDSDSDDSIISPQVHKPRQMHMIPEEAAEDEDGGSENGSMTGSSDQDSEFNEDDIENLLAPQEQTNKVENDLKMDRKPKASCDYVDIQVEQNCPTKTVYQSDSDEFDHFYD